MSFLNPEDKLNEWKHFTKVGFNISKVWPWFPPMLYNLLEK